MANPPYDPLTSIPSADTVRRKLAEIQETARRLKIVLKTAEQIERERLAEPRQEGAAHV